MHKSIGTIVLVVSVLISIPVIGQAETLVLPLGPEPSDWVYINSSGPNSSAGLPSEVQIVGASKNLPGISNAPIVELGTTFYKRGFRAGITTSATKNDIDAKATTLYAGHDITRKRIGTDAFFAPYGGFAYSHFSGDDLKNTYTVGGRLGAEVRLIGNNNRSLSIGASFDYYDETIETTSGDGRTSSRVYVGLSF